MDRCGTVLAPTAVNLALIAVDRIPAQGHKFRRPQPVPEGDQDHGLVPVTVPVAGAGRLAQPLDLGFGQVFPRPQLGIGLAPRHGGRPKNGTRSDHR
jgi:hypothetical protein